MRSNDNPGLAKQDQCSCHLTEDEFDELLMGIATPAAHAHLADCDLCRAQVQSFQAMVTSFNEATLEWSEAKSNTISRDLNLTARKPRFVLSPGVTWSLAGTLLLAVLGGVFELHIGRQQRDVAAIHVAASPVAAQASDGEIADDDAMLRAIDSEVNRVGPSPVAQYWAASDLRTDARTRQARKVME